MALIPYMARIQFDFGAVRTLRDELEHLSVARPLVVSDPGVVAAGLLERALASLPGLPDRRIYAWTPSNPTAAAVQDALRLLRDEGCDGLVAVGGGSSIDLAKGVALLATHAGPLEQYRARVGGTPRIGAGVLPLVAVPTTAGTGSEVGRGMGITLEDGEKAVFISQHLVPKAAICDPDLTLGLPPALTAGTGVDALSHCVESFLSPAMNPPADAVALDGARRLWAFLPRACRDGSDREARWNVMMGAVEGGMAIWKGLGAAHAAAVALEQDRHGLHHGTTVGVLLPHALRFVADQAREAAPRLRDALGLPPGADLAAAFARFNAAVGLPPDLRRLGVEPGAGARVGAAATASPFNGSSARRGSERDYADLVDAALRDGTDAPAGTGPA